jgi:hypothetical protein
MSKAGDNKGSSSCATPEPATLKGMCRAASTEMLARWILKNLDWSGGNSDENGQFLATILEEHRRQCLRSETSSINAAPQAVREAEARPRLISGVQDAGPAAAAPSDKSREGCKTCQGKAEICERVGKAFDDPCRFAPSATRCTACGAKEGEPCRGNCERAMPSSTRDIDEHGVLHGWRAAIAKACGNNDPVTPDGVERVVAAHVRHHVLGAAPVSASGATDYSGQAALLRSFAARIRDFNRPITPDSVIPHTLEDIADELDPVDRKAESPEGHQRSWEDHGGHKL